MKRLAVAVLAVFHAAVLWHRIVDASIAQPAVLAKWIASIALIGALLSLRNAHKALVIIWLLVALLHVGMPAGILLVLLVLVVPASAPFTFDGSFFDAPLAFVPRADVRRPQLGRSPPAA